MPATLLNQLENTSQVEKGQSRDIYFWGSAAGRVLFLIGQQQKLCYRHDDHDEGDKAFDEDSEEGDDNEAGDRNMNDGFIANTSFEQELTGNESTTFEDVTLDTL